MYQQRILGAAGAYDFTIGDINQDLAWHELDFSSIVPADASGMFLHCVGEASSVAPSAVFDLIPIEEANNAPATCFLRPQIVNKKIAVFKAIGVGPTRKCKYRVRLAVFTVINITVKGWWIP